MARYCFQLQVRPERLAEYRERHRAVWPEMLAALRAVQRLGARHGLAAAAARVRACGTPQDRSTPTSSTVRSSSSLMIRP